MKFEMDEIDEIPTLIVASLPDLDLGRGTCAVLGTLSTLQYLVAPWLSHKPLLGE